MPYKLFQANKILMKKAIKLKLQGMVCGGCEEKIKKMLQKTKGIITSKPDYKNQEVIIEYDDKKISQETIESKIKHLGYEVKKEKASPFNILGLLLILSVGFLLYNYFQSFNFSLNNNLNYGLVFLTGLISGFHCISMCGGFVLTYSSKKGTNYLSHLFYALGKLVSYTAIGALFGLLGSFIVITPVLRGTVAVIAGAFLLFYGLQMLDLFPWLRNFRLKTPDFVKKLSSKVLEKNSSPLIIGLLNGLMLACGPLQAMYIMAAGTGSMATGASLLFFFGLGTLPIMLGFAFVASMISSATANKIAKISGIIVAILGIGMIQNGLALNGVSLGFEQLSSFLPFTTQATSSVGTSEYQTIYMNVTRSGWQPNVFVLKQGILVKWVIDGKEITGCNNKIIVPELNLEFAIKQGEQTIEFTPTKVGTIAWSCWMGMIKGTFIVQEQNSTVTISQSELNSIAPKASSGCGCGTR